MNPTGNDINPTGATYTNTQTTRVNENRTKALQQGIVHETTSAGVEALTGMKIEDLKKNADLKNKVIVKKESAEGKMLRSEMQTAMKTLNETMSKLGSKRIPKDQKPEITEETLDKLALLKLAIDRCDKEVAEGGPLRQFRQNVAKTLGYSTTNEARSLIHEFNEHLNPEQREAVLNKYDSFVDQYSNALKDVQKKKRRC